MPRIAFLAAWAIAVLSLAVLSTRDSEALNPEIQMQFDLAIDTEVTGNGTSQLGSLEPCVAVEPGETFDVDLVVQGVGEPGVAGLAGDIIYDPSVVKIVGKDIDSFMLGIGDVAIELSDHTPDTDGDLRIDDVNLSGTFGTGDGVIERLTFEALAPGGSAIAWDDINPFGLPPSGENWDGTPDVVYYDASDPENPEYIGFFPNMRARGAEVVVGGSCPGNLVDGDDDGYSDLMEDRVETLVVQACPATAIANDEDDSWPPDFDDNQEVDILDILAFKPVFGLPASENARYDLMQGAMTSINVVDILSLKPDFGLSCS